MSKKFQIKQSNKVKKENDNNLYVPTVLSLLEHDETIMSDVQKAILIEEIEELPQIQEGQINLAGIYAYDLGDKLEVKAYIRNGLSTGVKLETIPFVIQNSKEEILAYQIFSLEDLGEIPAHSARPIKVYFDKKNLRVDSIPADDWKIAFDARVKAKRTINTQYENLPEGIEIDDKLVFDKFLNELPELKEGEFTISTFSVGIQKGGNILVTLVMRNGTEKPITIEKMPVTLKDANGTVVKAELFDLGKFSISPFMAKVCNLAFPTGVNVEQDTRLEGWTVSFQLEPVGNDANK
ncbi:SLAP domain-containing protein [Clostridium sp. DJ247]|uniref:SLAP domain-containing protein n=1 Tax=Clostridium sp. DJ247 TaxID=2726188 RepID=UPI001623F543|nr:SLAP domain-containing protein [Clostridium sp. DJ247]MBC2580183.1 SLAP domain-containing protein [Clostridium sp. DJ247]